MEPSDGNNNSSRLLSLPAELRLQIYGYIFNDIEYGWRAVQAWPLADRNAEGAHSDPHALALLRVSREVHAETALLPYKLGTFLFTTMRNRKQFFQNRLPEQMSAIRKVGFLVFYTGEESSEAVQYLHGLQLNYFSGFPGIHDLKLIYRTPERAHMGGLVKCLRELREKIRLHYPGLKRVTVSATRQGKDEAD